MRRASPFRIALTRRSVHPSARAARAVHDFQFSPNCQGTAAPSITRASLCTLTRISLAQTANLLSIDSLMFWDMRKPTNFQPLGDIAKRAAARLTIDHDGPGKGLVITPQPAGKPSSGQNSTSGGEDPQDRGQQPGGGWSGRPDNTSRTGPSQAPAVGRYADRRSLRLRAVGPRCPTTGRLLN